ncbi:DinB family protein [Pseudoxanthomonas mexicana]|uniref:DinB family protein n=1 Tax=Pseudoxanthomonas mexicana TaxID=128785 RepID=UPI00398A5A86
MTPSAVTLMANYNRWMNKRMYEAADNLSAEDIARDRGAFFGSILQTLNHIAVADTIWLHRFSQHPNASALREELVAFPQPDSLRQELASSLYDLRQHRDRLDEVILGWSSTLTSEQLASPLVYRNMAGQSFSRQFGYLVQHFFNHQAHHRGQASTLLFQAGVDIGVTDLLAVIPSEG